MFHPIVDLLKDRRLRADLREHIIDRARRLMLLDDESASDPHVVSVAVYDLMAAAVVGTVRNRQEIAAHVEQQMDRMMAIALEEAKDASQRVN